MIVTEPLCFRLYQQRHYRPNLRAIYEIGSSTRSIYDESDFIIDSGIRKSSRFGIWKAAKTGENKKINVEYHQISVYDFSSLKLTTFAFLLIGFKDCRWFSPKCRTRKIPGKIVGLDAIVSSGISLIYEWIEIRTLIRAATRHSGNLSI